MPARRSRLEQVLMRFLSSITWSFIFALSALAAGGSAHALEPDQIALVVNKNVPDSTALAQLYANQRGIPDGRIIALSLPVTEEIPFDLYERAVVPPIRQYLRDNQLDQRVKCLVTFLGVPFR